MAVSGPHEVIIELFTTIPDLLPRFLESACGHSLSYASVDDCSEAATITVPVEHRSDAVRVFRDAAGNPVLTVVVEVQLDKDPRKEWSWPVYLAEARRMHRCPTILVVVTPDSKTAQWANQRLDLGFGLAMMVPLVCDLSRFAPMPDARQAADNIGEAMLAMFGKEVATQHMDVLSTAFATLPVNDAKQYSGLMLTALQGEARDYWRKLMATGTYAYQNEYAREMYRDGEEAGKKLGKKLGKEVGELCGKRDSLYRILHHRGITVTSQAQHRIDHCDNATTLNTWTDRAFTITTIDELFDNPPAASE